MARLFFANVLNKQAARSGWLLRVLWAIEGAIFRVVAFLVALLPVEKSSAFGRWLLGRLGPGSAKSGSVRRNLEIAFPGRSEDEISALVAQVWGSLGAVLGEYPHLGRITRQDFERRIEIVNLGGYSFGPEMAPAVMVGAHLSNWEVIAGAMNAAGIQATVLYAPLQNPWINRLMRRYREAMPGRYLDRDQSVRELIRELKQGRSVGFVMDQRVDSGQPVPFFGHEKMTTTVPARLARRLGCDLVPVRTERLPGVRFRITFYPPVRSTEQDDQAAVTEVTAMVTALFEQWIREQPGEWFCAKRRWSKSLHKRRPEPGEATKNPV